MISRSPGGCWAETPVASSIATMKARRVQKDPPHEQETLRERRRPGPFGPGVRLEGITGSPLHLPGILRAGRHVERGQADIRGAARDVDEIGEVECLGEELDAASRAEVQPLRDAQVD